MRRLSVLLLSLGVFLGATADTHSPIIVEGRGTGSRGDLVARIAITGDVQNYVVQDGTHHLPTQQALATLLVDDIIRRRPDFVLTAGDLTGQTGGADQNCGAYSPYDDWDALTIFGGIFEVEWTRFKAWFYDRFGAAGIPYEFTLGNHDSCLDLERLFPAASFIATAWGEEVDSIPNACGGGSAGICGGQPPASTPTSTGTWNRRSLMTTPIGTICIVTTVDHVGAAGLAWVYAAIGCGAGRPTIVMVHSTVIPGLLNSSTTATQRGDLVIYLYGHFVCSGPSCVMSGAQFDTAHFANLTSTAFVGVNTQEVGFGNAYSDGGAPTNHTGLAWWTMLTIDPCANTISLQAHNPYLTDTSESPDSNAYAINNVTLALPYNWATEFGTGTAVCP